MKTKAAVAWKAGQPLTIETFDLEGPKFGEVLVEIKAPGQIQTAWQSWIRCSMLIKMAKAYPLKFH